MRRISLPLVLVSGVLIGDGRAQPIPQNHTSSARLSLPPALSPSELKEFSVPLPAYAQPPRPEPPNSFRVESSRQSSAPRIEEEAGSAQYLLPEGKNKESITPESANLNLPADTVVSTKDTGEKVTLPAGTYRQIMQFPIDSPLMDEHTQMRELKLRPTEVAPTKSRYGPPPTRPVWVRYESLEKIHIGEIERRGGLDLPSHGPAGLRPRIWYAKSESADWASSAFYFVFGGLGYGVANLAGWSAGNTREVAEDFEYRLIRR